MRPKHFTLKGIKVAGDATLQLRYADGERFDVGLARRMLAYYRSGAKPVPRTVALACLGWEKARKVGAQALAA